MKPMFWLLATMILALNVHACIWDADSLEHEKDRSKDLASAVLGEPPPADDPEKLRARITELEAHRDETNADWWNNLAGAHLRLNQPADAVKILEPVVAKFPNDYGIHANLGTAYHLLGHYAEAEKEIARDLEINPEAHFGLEKYHLALLQYLMRDAKYRSRHVYVDELTAAFLISLRGRMDLREADYISEQAKSDYTNGLADAEKDLAGLTGTNFSNWDYNSLRLLAEVSALDEKPPYRKDWDLAGNTNFEAGVIYMAQMNPKEPAAMEMLGVAAWWKRDYNLAVSAFEKAIALESPQADILRAKNAGLKDYIAGSEKSNHALFLAAIAGVCLLSLPVLIARYIYTKIRDGRRNRAMGK
jgi:Flp pilus assembly protein TadD